MASAAIVFPVPLKPENNARTPNDEEANFPFLADNTDCRASRAILRNISACFKENDILAPDRLD
jgi:hypothetical protein